MKPFLTLVPPVGAVVPASNLAAPASGRSITTRDRIVILAWAERHHAEPAFDDGRAAVEDSAEPVRFNFPGLNRYRPVSWDEWFEGFQQHHLAFVYEEDVADRAHELWLARQDQDGDAGGDWLTAQRQLTAEGAHPCGGFRFVRDQ